MPINIKVHATLTYAFSYRLNDSIQSNCQTIRAVSAKHAAPAHNVLQCLIVKFDYKAFNTTKNTAIMIAYFHYIEK